MQDPRNSGDPRADLRTATVALSADKRYLAVSAQLYQPTSPTTENWWRGTSLPRPGITFGSPERVRFTAYVQLYNDTADGIIGGEYAPTWDEFSPWLSLR